VLFAALGAFAAASVQSATGFGYALVAGPLLFAVLEPEEAVTLLLVTGMALNLLMLFGERRRPRVAWREIAPLLAAAAPGVVAGVFVLDALSKPVLQIGVGAVVIAAALLRLLRTAPMPSSAPERSGAAILGLASGILTTSTSVNGPPLVLWLTRRGLRPDALRDSLSACFLVLGAAGTAAVVLLLGADRSVGEPAWLLLLLPLVAAGHAVGRRLFARLDGPRHERLLMIGAAVAGVASVVAGLGALAT